MPPSTPSTAAPAERTRIDKWLWAVRLFKTRALASEACRGGHVKIAGLPVKASREVLGGETIRVRSGELERTVKVLAPIERRVGANRVKDAMEDLTPAEEYLRVLKQEKAGAPTRPKGAGRPTKKERRQLDQFDLL